MPTEFHSRLFLASIFMGAEIASLFELVLEFNLPATFVHERCRPMGDSRHSISG